MSDFEQQPKLKIIENDTLFLVRKAFVEVYDYKITNIFLKITSLNIILFTIFQSYLFLKKFNGYYFIKYSAVYTGFLYVNNL